MITIIVGPVLNPLQNYWEINHMKDLNLKRRIRMKLSRVLVSMAVFFALGFGLLSIPDGKASTPWPKKDGVVCFEVRDAGGTALGTQKLFVSGIKGKYYHVYFEVTSEDGNLINLGFGTARVVNDKVYMTMVNSGKNDVSMYTGTSHIVLDRVTLNGVAESIGHDRNYLDLSIDTEYEISYLYYIPSCNE